MVEKGWPWDSIDADRPFAAQHIADACASVLKNGVVDTTDFAVSITMASVGRVQIGEGGAWIDGRYLHYGGEDEIVIPFSASASAAVYGLIVLKCNTSVLSRNFSLSYKAPVGQADAEAGAGEIGIAKVRYNRGSAVLQNSDIVRVTTLAMPRNNGTNTGDATDIEGLICGADGKLKKAEPGVDYLSMAGGNLTGPVSVNGKPLSYIVEEISSPYNTQYDTMPGEHIVKYANGYMTASCAIGQYSIPTQCVQAGNHTIFRADSSHRVTFKRKFARVDNVNGLIIGGSILHYTVDPLGMAGTGSQSVEFSNIEAHYWGETPYAVGDTKTFVCGLLAYAEGWWQ